MADVVKKIGLSLGADICWPFCYQEIINELKLNVAHGGDRVRLNVKRVTIEPFDLRSDCPYDLVIDRLTHWYFPTREWIKKSIIHNDLYVFNNPWSVQSMEKQTSYCAMMRLGLPVPDTWLVPPKEYEPADDLQVTLERYADMFDLGEVGEKLGYPMYMKPYDGGAWVGVSRINDRAALEDAYAASGKRVMHLQRAVEPYDRFVRCVGMGPQVRLVNYDPGAPLHDRYTTDTDFVEPADARLLENMTLTINAFFGWDFNSCEAVRHEGVWRPIDFANACPDSQVTSLHFHFPWLINANIRWSVFCVVTGRPFQKNLEWGEFYAAHDPDLPLDQQLEAYAAIARRRFDAERFEEFCAKQLNHLDEVSHSFFGSDIAKTAVRQKVQALFPEHEVEEYTELFWGRIQDWRELNASVSATSRPEEA